MDLIPVNPSAAQTLLATTLRIAILIVGGITTLFGLLRKADLEGLYAYVQSADGLTFIGAVSTAATAAWALYSRYVSHREKARAADPRDPATLVLKQ